MTFALDAEGGIDLRPVSPLADFSFDYQTSIPLSARPGLFEGRLVLPAGETTGELASFAPVVISTPDPPAPKPARTPRAARHDAPLSVIEAKGIVVRVRRGADPALVETGAFSSSFTTSALHSNATSVLLLDFLSLRS